MRKYFLKITIFLAAYFFSIATITAQKAEVEKKLQEYGIPQGFFENNLKDENANHTFKTKTTNVTSTETKVEVAAFDPTQPEGERWKLLSVNGNEPSKKEIKQFNKSHNISDKSEFGEPDDDDWRIAEDNDQELIVEVRYRENHLPHKYKFLAGCVGKVFIDKKRKLLEKMEFYNTEPLKIKISNVDKLDMTVFYQLEEGTRTYLIKQEDILMTARLLGQSVEVKETIVFFDYERIR